MSKEPHWVRAAYDVSGVLGVFAHEVSCFLPDRSEVRKSVLVAGQGHAFPERTLVCTAQSRFRIQRPDIHPLILADPGEHIDPGLVMESPVHREILSDEKKRNAPIAEYDATFFSASLQELLPTFDPDSLNALVFFGIHNLSDQLRCGLGNEITRVLKPNAMFVGSGNFSDDDIFLVSGLALEGEVPLAPRDSAGNTYSRRIGFVARKTSKK